jgi:cytochrome c oxidase assembly protein subunit 15
MVDNPIVVQFIHRWLAFAVAAAALLLAGRAWGRGVRRSAGALAVLVGMQIVLGIATLLSGVEIHIAVAHQAVAVLLLAAAVAASHALGAAREARAA